MAPVPEPESTLTNLFSHILKRIPSTSPISPPTAQIQRRDGPVVKPQEGVTPFQNVPNKAIFSLFGLIGVFFVVLGIWFFFWAKNGGFYFKEDDWDDYKSTVLRRKGPNGTTLSGATSHTDLGGGSVVHGEKSGGRSVWGRKKREKRYQDFDEETAYMGSGGGSSVGSDISEIKREKKRAQKAAKKAEKEKEKEKKTRSRFGRKKHDDEMTVVTEALSLSHAGVEEDVDPEVRDAVRAYRHEKPARVGGLNKPSEGTGSTWDGSTEASSDLGLMSHREPTPTNTPVKKSRRERPELNSNTSGIRKVVSTSHGNHNSALSHTDTTDFWTRSHAPIEEQSERDRERERIKAEARRLQEKGRAASAHSRQSGSQSQSQHRSSRRDFSFQHGDDDSHTVVSSTLTSTTINSEELDRQARREARRAERERRAANRESREDGKEKSRSRSPKKLSVPGSYYEDSVLSGSTGMSSDVSGDTGTKSYPCIIPGLSVNKDRGNAADDYKEERRKRRANGGGGGGGGYRRTRRDSLE